MAQTDIGKGHLRFRGALRFDLYLAGAGFCVVLAAGLALNFADAIAAWARQNALIASISGGAFCFILWRDWKLRASIRTLCERIGVGDAKPLVRAFVIDGDTVDDRATGVRYRLANIDAPETGENARCASERAKGEQARALAIALVRNASNVSVRRTWRKDRYGRRIAYVLIDGRDLGEILLAEGLASPWRGWRARWCGPSGPLSKMAASRGEPFACRGCAHWRKA